MRRIKLALPVIAALVALPVAAPAKDVPFEIHWLGQAPTAVLLSVPGGLLPLQKVAGSPVFRGQVTLPEAKPERRTITVQYGSYSHPFDVRLHRHLPRVTFLVSHQTQTSCTRTRVVEADRAPATLVDAVARAIAAGELISIPEPNACDPNLRFGALQARFRQNAKMAEISNGFFMINRSVEDQYKQAARDRGLSVESELAQYNAKDTQLEVRQLIAFRTAAVGSQNYKLALDVNSFMAARISADGTTAARYQQQGITNLGLATYSQQLQLNSPGIQRYATNPPPSDPATDPG